MTRITIPVLLAVFVLFACNNDEQTCVQGSGITDDYVLTLNTFNSIALEGPINLNITQGPNQEVVVVAEPEIFVLMTQEVDNGTLEIGFEDNTQCFDTNVGVTVNVTLPDLESIQVAGVSDVQSVGMLDLDALNVTVAGTANVTLAGSVDTFSLESSGVTTMRNFDLISQAVTVIIAGTGDLELTAEATLNIIVSGAATIKYKGTPQITQQVSGTLSLIDSN